MSRFIRLTKVEYYKAEGTLEESPLFVNIDAIAYVESKVVHLTTGETILCKESEDHIVALITE